MANRACGTTPGNPIGYRHEAGSLLNRRRHSHFCGDSNPASCIQRKARHWR